LYNGGTRMKCIEAEGLNKSRLIHRGVWSPMSMNNEMDIARFFSQMPGIIPVYGAIEDGILSRFENVSVEICKTQISFKSKKGFAYVWLPVRKMKNRPNCYLVLSFGLDKRIQSPRILESVETYKDRWMHHLIIENQGEIDDEVMDWINQAYTFARSH